MKNRVLLSLSKIFQKRNAKTNRILVVSTTALGDTLWATPALESLRKSFPHSYVAVLTSSIGKEVLEQNPYVDQIFSFQGPLSSSFFSLFKMLKKERFDTVLLFHASQRLTFFLISILGANQLISVRGMNKGLDSLFTKILEPKYEHEIERRLRIISEIGAKTHTRELSFFREEKTAKKRKQILLHPGSKDGFKRWPKDNFIILGNLLMEKTDFQVVITGTEKELTREIASKIKGASIKETHSLNELASLMQESALLIANDTGTVHLASALKLPLIALYGPTDPNLCGPYKAENAHVLSVSPTCFPCIKRKCKKPFCLWQISPEEILEKALTMLFSFSKKEHKPLLNNEKLE